MRRRRADETFAARTRHAFGDPFRLLGEYLLLAPWLLVAAKYPDDGPISIAFAQVAPVATGIG